MSEPEIRWRIIRRDENAIVLVGFIYAPDRETAIQKTIREHGVTDPEHQQQLVAQRQGRIAIRPPMPVSITVSVKQYSWRIYRVWGNNIALIGVVTAPDEHAAIQKAIGQHGITDPEHQKRLQARRRV